MIKVTYTIFCDRCKKEVDKIDSNAPGAAFPPTPTDHTFYGMELCNPCLELVQKAVDSVLTGG